MVLVIIGKKSSIHTLKDEMTQVHVQLFWVITDKIITFIILIYNQILQYIKENKSYLSSLFTPGNILVNAFREFLQTWFKHPL